jgi:hypothetical protein
MAGFQMSTEEVGSGQQRFKRPHCYTSGAWLHQHMADFLVDVREPMVFVDLNPETNLALVPTGSLIKTNSSLARVDCRAAGRHQRITGHKEPGVGTHVPWINSAAFRYKFIEIVPPMK